MTLEHHLVFDLGVRAARFHVMLAIELLIIVGGRTLQRKRVLPPIHDAIVLREETVAADIHAVSIVLHGAGNAAEFMGFFQNSNVVPIGTAVLDQFPSRGQASRATADNHYGLLVGHVQSPYVKSCIFY